VLNNRDRKTIKAFGERIQDLRLNKGLSQEDLAAKANIPTTQISRIERGAVNTTLSTMSVVASALGVDIKDLLDFSKNIVEPVKTVNPADVKKVLSGKFKKAGSRIKIKKKGGYFEAWLDDKGKGIRVSNLGENNLLEWKVFSETVTFLLKNNNRAERGNAMKHKLGEPGLSKDTVEGYIAKSIYGKKEGESVFRRITPISEILIWAGICKPLKGKLSLR